MDQTQTAFSGILTSAILMGCAGVAFSAEPVFVDEFPVEWVAIQIHMPDGRVIERTERRFPSRSRILTMRGVNGKLPAFRRSAEPTDAGVEIALNSESVIDSTIDSTAGDDLVVQAGEIESEPIDITSEVVPTDEVVESSESEESSGPVKTFKKSPRA